jgi:transglutaminase-like putative cysteine protease
VTTTDLTEPAAPVGPQRLEIVHNTGFSYPAEAVASYNEARMTPLTTPVQMVLDARIEVQPPAATYRYWDYWGTLVTAFDVRVPHTRLTVTATSVVETQPYDDDGVAVSWDELRNPLALDRFAELLAPRARSEPGDEALAQAREVTAGLPPREVGAAVAGWLSEVMEYVPGATGVHTRASQAWEVRKGVCQDFAHIAVGVLRAVGVPARYVSGYLLPRSDAPVGESVAGESHAWIEWWAGSWRAWDPTNGRAVGPEYVVVARGRDYDDVPPLKGIYSGPSGGELFVGVEFTRLA